MKTRRRAFVGSLLLVLLILLFTGCASDIGQSTASVGLEGGSTDLGNNVNLREVSIEMQGDTTLVHLSFINGSRYAGVEEAKISSIPVYEVRQINNPPRLEVSLQIGFADYAQAGTVFQGSVVDGLFDCVLADQTQNQLFLQLNAPVDVTCEADGSTLTLALEPKEGSTATKWFVGLNAMAQYLNGAVPEDLGFWPTLCDDFGNRILISAPMDARDEADELIKRAKDVLPSSIPDSAFYVFDMEENALPPYQSIASDELVASVDLLEIDGTAQTLPVFLENGKYLTTGPDGTIVYSVPYLPNAATDSDKLIKEEVWAKSPDGSQVQYGTGDFYDVTNASYSFDGRYLGILDTRTSNQVLYVYDTTDGSLRNLGEEGFGNSTVSFVWDPSANIIYAMTGTNGDLQLLRYDFNAPADTPNVSSVEERNGADSPLAYADGSIYFANPDDRTIYAVDLATGERTALTSGADMCISADGRYMAVLSWRDTPAEEVAFDLCVADAKTGELLRTVMENVQVSDFRFGADSDTLYFTTQYYDGVSEEFPFALLCYTISSGQTELICYSKTEIVSPSPTPGELYLVYYLASDNENRDMMPVTYLYDGNK